MKYFVIYLIIISLISFIIVGIDKRKAINGMYRIPESTIFLFAFLGGSVGVFIGMKKFHHKTKKLKFKIGIPLIIIIQLAIACILYFY